jgi:hypothetical protein
MSNVRPRFGSRANAFSARVPSLREALAYVSLPHAQVRKGRPCNSAGEPPWRFQQSTASAQAGCPSTRPPNRRCGSPKNRWCRLTGTAIEQGPRPQTLNRNTPRFGAYSLAPPVAESSFCGRPCTLGWHSRTLAAMNTKASRSLSPTVGAAHGQPNPSIEGTHNGGARFLARSCPSAWCKSTARTG